MTLGFSSSGAGVGHRHNHAGHERTVTEPGPWAHGPRCAPCTGSSFSHGERKPANGPRRGPEPGGCRSVRALGCGDSVHSVSAFRRRTAGDSRPCPPEFPGWGPGPPPAPATCPAFSGEGCVSEGFSAGVAVLRRNCCPPACARCRSAPPSGPARDRPPAQRRVCDGT